MNPIVLTYDFEMDPSARGRHRIPIENDSTGPVQLKALRFTSNGDITYPGQLLGRYWQNVQKVKDPNSDIYIYTLPLDPPLSIPKGKTDLLQYDVGNALGPLNQVVMPPQKMEISFDGSNFDSIGWSDVNQDPKPHPKFELQNYHANWGQYDHHRTMANEPLSVLNALTYAFVGFDESGRVFALDSWAEQLELPELYKQKRKNGFKTTLGFGGWTNAGKRMDTVFSAMAASPITRQKFVKSAVAAVLQAGADGIDIDWEYPKADDAANYVTLLKELRAELKARVGENARLTIATPAGDQNIQIFSSEQWQTMAGPQSKLIDRVNLMCYDYFGAWDRYADFHAPWQLADQSPHKNTQFSIEQTLAIYQKNNVDPQKISLGMPNYARAVLVANPGQYAGLYQEVVGAPPGDLGEAGFYSWNSIFNLLNKQPSSLDSLGVKEWFFYDSDHPLCKKAGMCLLSGCLPDGKWVVLTFLDQKAAKRRAELITQKGFGGSMIWANYCEPVDQKNTIAQAISDGLSAAPQQQLQTKIVSHAAMSSMSLPKIESAIPKASIPKEKEFDKTSIRSRIANYAAKLRGFFGSHDKAKIVDEIRNASNSHHMGQVFRDEKKKEKLLTHRNIFKRFLSAIFPQLFLKPKSYRLAEEFYNTKLLFESDALPSQIVTEKTKPNIAIADSYSKIMAEAIRPPAVNPMVSVDVGSNDALPVHHGSIIMPAASAPIEENTDENKLGRLSALNI